MKFLRRHWYNIGLVIMPVSIGLAFLLPNIQTLQTILLLNFAALLIHQFEEYGWPGGGPSPIVPPNIRSIIGCRTAGSMSSIHRSCNASADSTKKQAGIAIRPKKRLKSYWSI